MFTTNQLKMDNFTVNANFIQDFIKYLFKKKKIQRNSVEKVASKE